MCCFCVFIMFKYMLLEHMQKESLQFFDLRELKIESFCLFVICAFGLIRTQTNEIYITILYAILADIITMNSSYHKFVEVSLPWRILSVFSDFFWRNYRNIKWKSITISRYDDNEYWLLNNGHKFYLEKPINLLLYW